MTAVLCARADSVYKSIVNLDVYDLQRDAFNFSGGQPVIAHPPCRSWGRLRHFAKPRQNEQDLARFCVDSVRLNGGVLEHPAGSTLWTDKAMSNNHRPDRWGGWTLPISQNWFGHKAEKLTWLYIVGLSPKHLPPINYDLSYPTHVVENSSSSRNKKPTITKSEREHTPIDLAYFLIEIAELSTPVMRVAS